LAVVGLEREVNLEAEVAALVLLCQILDGVVELAFWLALGSQASL
jgi:hypothetical protein